MPDKLALSTSIDELDLSPQAYNALCKNGIHTLRALLQTTPEQAGRMRHIGVTTIWNIATGISKAGHEWPGYKQWELSALSRMRPAPSSTVTPSIVEVRRQSLTPVTTLEYVDGEHTLRIKYLSPVDLSVGTTMEFSPDGKVPVRSGTYVVTSHAAAHRYSEPYRLDTLERLIRLEYRP